ncbi:MAG TPA: cupin-like domain-containing protein [Candidatus Acidoferrales bacterium]|nr:cupin-like domain-containing protein [Candidatus Acidoferrales bacterium]
MKADECIGSFERAVFQSMFSMDWLFGEANVTKLLPRRWERLRDRMLANATSKGEGRVSPVDRRREFTPGAFLDEYFLPGIPVVLEGAAAEWPAVKKWTPEYLNQLCGRDEVAVLDGQNWTANQNGRKEAVSTSETIVEVQELLKNVTGGGAWYGAFLELMDKYPGLREDIDLSFVKRFGHMNEQIPWQRRVLAKMYVGGPGTATSFHCAGVSNLFVQMYGKKKWVLIAPQYTPFMYPASNRGINWQSRVDFRDPDYASCPLYRFVDRHETVLEPGDVLWNPPFVWHGVANLTESIAVSLWWFNVTRAFRNSFLLSALSLCGSPNPIALQLGLSHAQDSSKSQFGVHLNR